MKLSHKIDLDSKKGAVAAKIDAAFEVKAATLDPTPKLHAAKLRLAHFAYKSETNARLCPSLVAEAGKRAISTDDLCSLIFSKDDALLFAMANLEVERQAAHASLATLQSEQAIIAFAATIGT